MHRRPVRRPAIHTDPGSGPLQPLSGPLPRPATRLHLHPQPHNLSVHGVAAPVAPCSLEGAQKQDRVTRKNGPTLCATCGSRAGSTCEQTRRRVNKRGFVNAAFHYFVIF